MKLDDGSDYYKSHAKSLETSDNLAACKMRGRTCRGLNAFGSILIDFAPGGHIFTLDMGEGVQNETGAKKGGKESWDERDRSLKKFNILCSIRL